MNDSQKQSLQTQVCQRFSLSEIQIATQDFNEHLVIGRGGFGKVYKGAIKIGLNDVVAAIKRLHVDSCQGASEFWAEVEMLSRLRHCNLASLLGYCNEGEEMIVVYEYMPLGTLESFLHKKPVTSSHSWLLLLKICIGAARGLDYLHTGTGTKQGIIHRDVKSSNILLDENYAAKISDFGLAKVSPTNQTHTYVSTGVKGTFGYMDPRYFYTSKLTRKSDVYAFGVVLFEALCGRPAVDTSLEEEKWGLAAWAQSSIKDGKLSQIVDSRLKDQISTNCLKEFAQIAVSCIHAHANQRPIMSEVVAKLELALSLQEKSDPCAENGKVRKKVGSSFSSKVTKFSKLIRACVATSERIDEVNKLGLKLGSKVDADSEYGGQLVHFDSGFDFTISELLTASNKYLNGNRYCRTYVAYLAEDFQVIVKRILTELSRKKFVSIVSSLGKLRHPNVLNLTAYYWGRGETLCVYKFIPNGTVACLILPFETEGRPMITFDWATRMHTILGITRGLFYLHNQEKIVHGELKSGIVLFDELYNPVICNVGISWLMPATPRRFRNNCAPEFTGVANATTEIDVYSLGVIMLELLTGQSTYIGINPIDLPSWVKSIPAEKWFDQVFDEKLMQENSNNGNVLVKVMALALQCVEYNPKARPTVKDVLWTLEEIQV
ncbi:unnamed protein product [Lactuca virosa]|uniref:Protein kinase domain-containing protein n=1 Tax=Lactuca virosa TaxID=75947 RepID=A0AAU9LTD3_9ASTR|nr:unnamed protein product [Lactuca virosa]